MKTLDEVINALEVCTSGYCSNRDGDCPYLEHNDCDTRQRKLDALHYLKEYQRDKQIYSYDIARRNLELAERNDPLSWNELKAMKGKPVWVVEEGYQTWEYWSLVYWMKGDELTLLNENGQTTYPKNEQGTVWQAYRKERE